MSWLNWSLKFHIRLKTISSLVPTHITHVYVQWMPYSFMWLYLFKCVAHAQSHVDQTQKDFWVFLESVLVLKNFKNLKNCATLFWWLYLVGTASHEPLVTSLLRSFCDSLVGQALSRKKDLEKFQKFRFLAFSWLCLATGLRVEAPIASLLRLFHNSLRDLLRVDLSVVKNT